MATIDINQYIEQSGMRKARFGGYEPDDVRQAMLDLCSDYEQRLNTAAQQVRGAQQEAEALRRLRHADLCFRLRHRHRRRLALLLRQLRRDRPRQRLQDAVRPHVPHPGQPGSGRQQDGPDRRGRLHR